MSRAECPREDELVGAIGAGEWPSRVDVALRNHVEACATCAGIALVVPSLRDDYLAMSAHVQVPLAGQVWWRVAVRARLDTAHAAARPIAWMHGVVGAGVAGFLVALIRIVWPSLVGSMAWISALLLPREPGGASLSAMFVSLLRQTMPLLVVVAVCLVIAPVAVYLATSDD